MHISNFVSRDLSSFYCDMTKDILYCEPKSSVRRLQVQTAYYRILSGLIYMLTPLLPFTMEEAYKELPGTNQTFAQLNDYPDVDKLDLELLKGYDALLEVRDVVLKKLEEGRSSGIFGSAQEARVVLTLPQGIVYDLLSHIDKLELARYFIVSEVQLKLGEAVAASVTRHQGHKCDRCWNYYDDIKHIEEVKLCDRCLEALDK